MAIILSRNSCENWFVCWFEISKLKSFIFNLNGVWLTIGNSRKFLLLSYQYLSRSVHARITVACLLNALLAWCKQESHHKTWYLAQRETTNLKSSVSSILHQAISGCHFLITSYRSYHFFINWFAMYCASFTYKLR